MNSMHKADSDAPIPDSYIVSMFYNPHVICDADSREPHYMAAEAVSAQLASRVTQSSQVPQVGGAGAPEDVATQLTSQWSQPGQAGREDVARRYYNTRRIGDHATGDAIVDAIYDIHTSDEQKQQDLDWVSLWLIPIVLVPIPGLLFLEAAWSAGLKRAKRKRVDGILLRDMRPEQ